MVIWKLNERIATLMEYFGTCEALSNKPQLHPFNNNIFGVICTHWYIVSFVHTLTKWVGPNDKANKPNTIWILPVLLTKVEFLQRTSKNLGRFMINIVCPLFISLLYNEIEGGIHIIKSFFSTSLLSIMNKLAAKFKKFCRVFRYYDHSQPYTVW